MEYKKGLVMEGGAMRGMFTVGIIDVLMENGIEFDGAVGVSAGAAFGCNYKSRQPGRAIRYNTRFCRDKRYCGYHSLIKTGDIFGAEFCYHTIPDELDVFDRKAFEENKMDFYVVCTDINTGKPVYKNLLRSGDEEMTWIRASASMPLASRIVEADGKMMLDGGMSDSIPLEFFESVGYNKNIVILTQPRGYIKHKNRAMPLIRLVYRKYPKLIETMEKRHDMYNAQTEYVAKAEKDGRALVFRPENPLPIGHIEHNADNLRRVYELGRKAATARLSQVKNFLS